MSTGPLLPEPVAVSSGITNDTNEQPDYSHLPRSRAEARAVGSKTYLTGVACKHGHAGGERRTIDAKCVECRRETKRKDSHRYRATPGGREVHRKAQRRYEATPGGREVTRKVHRKAILKYNRNLRAFDAAPRLYVVVDPTQPGVVKLGMTDKNPRERLRIYQTGSARRAFRYAYLIKVENAEAAEDKAFAALDHHRVSHEWFAVDVATAIAEVSKHALPGAQCEAATFNPPAGYVSYQQRDPACIVPLFIS